MCGISGYIGSSNDPRATFELAHALFVKTEQRGEHASGFWSCEKGDGKVFFDKEPIKSSVYVTRDIWSKSFSKVDADLLLTHCRFSSTGVGHERVNKNNHPHVNDDKRVALVHNGKVPEYQQLRNRYELASDCDSEILLRMFESTEDATAETQKEAFPKLVGLGVSHRLLGIKEIFARVNYGAMAVAVGERGDDGSRFLWLFRDDDRPLHVVDMRRTIGQIFFCSTAEIWRQATEACPLIKPYIADNQLIIEFSANQIWLMAFDAQGKWLLKKFRITKNKFHDYKEEDIKIHRRKSAKNPLKVVSRLGKDEEIVPVTPDGSKVFDSRQDRTVPIKVETKETPLSKKKVDSVTTTKIHLCGPRTSPLLNNSNNSEDFGDCDPLCEAVSNSCAVVDTPEIDMVAFKEVTDDIQNLLSDIKTQISNLEQEGSLDPKSFEMVLSGLKDAKAELEAIKQVIP